MRLLRSESPRPSPRPEVVTALAALFEAELRRRMALPKPPAEGTR